MVFSSQIFLFVFLPVTLLAYYLIRPEFRRYLLILLSLLFFAWTGLKPLLFFVGFVVGNYFLGLIVGITSDSESFAKKFSIWLAVLFNLSFLFVFKYLTVFTNALIEREATSLINWDLPVLIGVSFFVFSAISYHFDVYNKKILHQTNIVNFFLYMSFFPKLLQGPIMREGDFKDQIANIDINLDKLSAGIYRFTLGLAKKVLIADQLGALVDSIFIRTPFEIRPTVAWLGAISFAMQIFFDFSGYSDMAIGLGWMLGFNLPENFNAPYTALNITDFWRRWHITLSSWFRDYVFYPLEFKRRKQKNFRTESNTMAIFFLTGLWHGAGWQFIVWGLWHGLFASLETFLRNKKVNIKSPKFFRYITTMLIVLIGWVLFRSPNLTYAIQYLGTMFGLVRSETVKLSLSWYLNNKTGFLLIISILACVPWKLIFSAKLGSLSTSKWITPLRLSLYLLLLALSVIMVLSSTYNSFIYFNF